MANTDLTVAAAYIRVSTEDQTDLSPESQLEKVKEYAAKNNMLLPSEFIFHDDGISGRAANKRPGFQRMIAAAKDPVHPFSVIIVWKYSRFARNQEESIFYKSILRSKCNVDVISVSEPLIAGPFGSLIERIIEWMDEFYSVRLSEEVKRSMTVNAKNGVLQSTASFGYKVENGVLVPVPEEAELIKEIFHRFLSGEGFYPIAQDLNSRGIKTHRGSRFENRTVEYIIRNPVYIGKLRWNPSGRTRRDFHNENIICAKGAHEPLIDEETWEAAQLRVEQLKSQWAYHGRPSSDRKHWLCGIVRCASCGATLIWSQPHFLKCNNYARGSCKTSQHIAVELIEEAFIQQLRHDFSFSSEISYQIIDIPKPQDTRAGQLRRNRDRMLSRLARSRDAYMNGIDSLEDYAAIKVSIQKEIDQIDAELSTLESASGASTEVSMKDSIKRTLETLESDAPISKKYDAVKRIIDTCTFDKQNMLLSIVYRYEI